MAIKVTFNGGRELERALAQLGKTADKVGRDAVRKAAKELHAEVRLSVPVSTGTTVRRRKKKDGTYTIADYGHLRDNLKVRLAPRKMRRKHSVEFDISVGNAFWGRFLEFGTRKMPAQPFFRPVWDRSSGNALNTISDALWAGISRQNKKLGISMPAATDGLLAKD